MRARDIIAVSVVLGLFFLSIMVVVARFLWAHPKNAKSEHDEKSEYSLDPVKRKTSIMLTGGVLKKLFTPKQERGHYVPNLSAIIKAGDEGIPSTIFSELQDHPGQIPLEALHDAFANELRNRPTSQRSSFTPALSSFLSTTRKPLQRSLSVNVNKREATGRGNGRPDFSPKPRRTSLDLAELGLGRVRSKRIAPVLVRVGDGSQGVDHAAWANDLQHALYFEGQPGITVTKRELAALSLVLGAPIELAAAQSGEKRNDGKSIESQTSAKIGAHGISISGATSADGKCHISLTQHKRSIAHLSARGSSYSTLYAKHLACGSLPFSADATNVNTILITKETLAALQAGAPLQIQAAAPQAPASTFLASLPLAKSPAFHTFHSTASNQTPTTPNTLLKAIANLPFSGGLTPLASSPLIQTTHFIASGGLVPGRLLPRLDALIEKVHRQAPHLHLFGPLLEDRNAGLFFREREKLNKLAIGALNSSDESLTDKAARVQRYITLVERLMYLVPDMRPDEVRDAVKAEVARQMAQAYQDAVAMHTASTTTDASSTPKRHASLSRHSTSRSKRSKRSSSSSFFPVPESPVNSIGRKSAAISRCSSTFPPLNLGACVEGVLKMSLPLDVATVALVVRLVVVAWTLSVGKVAWEEGEEGFRLFGQDGEEMPEKMVLW